MSSQFSCDRAIFRIVPHGSSYFDSEELLSASFPDGCAAAMVGFLSCPRGCGTLVYWALTPEMVEYKEQFLLFLHQQLSWTACPDHAQIQNQRASVRSETDWGALPSSSAVMAGCRRYRNLYE